MNSDDIKNSPPINCVISLHCTQKSGSATYRKWPIAHIELNWDEMPEEIKSFINKNIEQNWKEGLGLK